MAAGKLIGLDIGSTSVRAVETSNRKERPAIVNFAQAALPPDAVQAGVVQDERAVTLALKQLWAKAKFRSRDVVLGVTNPQVVVREMAVSNLPAKEMRASLPFQVRSALPLPVEKTVLDFCPLEDPGAGETVRGLLVAAPKDAVLTAVRAVERAGLRVARVDLAAFAMLRAVSQPDSGIEALVDIGAHSTSLVVHAHGEPLIVRTVPRGSAGITEFVATRVGATLSEAEELKRRVGLRTQEGNEVAEAVNEAVRPLVNEIRSSFAYLTASDGQRRVARLTLSGGGSLLPGLVDLLARQLEIEVAVADPAGRLADRRRGAQHSLERLDSSAAVSIGLTLGAA